MKFNKEVEVPSSKKMVLDCIVCDFCGAKSASDVEWPGDSFQTKETTVSYKNTYCYPDFSGQAKTVLFDICPICFETKLLPWAASLGAQFRTEETDW